MAEPLIDMLGGDEITRSNTGNEVRLDALFIFQYGGNVVSNRSKWFTDERWWHDQTPTEIQRTLQDERPVWDEMYTAVPV